ncbi:transmembrane protein C16orf54 homolog [Tenrec ecaudatus]|uniref:transmembrane protein C16orf54 homolog n=1 Tax=Tenrec ecaudatus TaxID=94439 RepID=UPI003F5A23DA
MGLRPQVSRVSIASSWAWGPGYGIPSAAEPPSGHMEGPPASEPALWPPLPCGPCIPIMLALASLAALFLVTTAVLAERLFRRSLRRRHRHQAYYHPPTLVWRPGGELWIEPTGTPRERSENWYGSTTHLLMDQGPEPPAPGSTLEARATAPPVPSTPQPPPSSMVSQPPPQSPSPSTFWVPPPWEERPHNPGMVSWAGPEPRPTGSEYPASPQAQRPRRPGSPEPDWGLQPRVTLEQISAFWRREGRTSTGF